MIRGLKAAVIIISAAAIFFTYCANDNPTVAMVGGKTVRLKDLQHELAEIHGDTPLSQISYEAALSSLNTMIKNELVLKAALQDGFDQREKIRSILEKNHDTFLLNRLFQKVVLDRVIKESDIRDYYNLSGRVVTCKNIFFQFPGRATASQRDSVKAVADSIYALITGGASYEDMVSKWSQDPVSRKKGGLIGDLSWTRPDDPITIMAFHLKKGEVGKPVMNRMGCNILKVTNIQQNETRESYTTARPHIISILRQARRKELTDAARKYQVTLQKKYKVVYHDSLISKTGAKILSFGKTAGAVSEGLRKEDGTYLDLPLAEYTFGEFTVRQLIDNIAEYRVSSKFSIPDSTALKSYVSKWIWPLLLVHNAKDRGLDKDPDLIEKYTEFSRNYIIDRYREVVIVGSTDFPDSEITAFYEKYKDAKYREPETRQVREIYVKDLDKAKEIHAKLQNGAPMDQLAEQFTERRGYGRRKGMLGFIKQQSWGEIGQQAFRMRVGEISDPITLTGSPGYSIIKVLAVKPWHYLSIESNRARIRSDLLNKKIATRTNKWYTDRKASTDIAINKEVLADVFTKQSQNK